MRIVTQTTLETGGAGEKRRVYSPGTPVDLPDAAARDLIKRGLATSADAAEAEVSDADSQDSRAEQIAEAILELDEDDGSLWLQDGRPKVEAVEAVLDAAVSAAERDAAWASLQG